MTENLITILEEQVFLNFTGKINVLDQKKRMHIGIVLFEDGHLINAKIDKLEGMEALKSLFYFEFDKREMSFVVEPELTSNEIRKIHYPFSVIKNKLTDFLQTHYNNSKKAPPRNIKVAVNSNFLTEGQTLSANEFDVLKVICDYNLISEIYDEISLPEHIVTNALVKLREKKAINVIE